MGNMETRQEVTVRDPEGEKGSRTATETVRNQLSNPTIAGEKRHTVNEPRNPENSSTAVVTGQAPDTQQPQSVISLSGKDPDERDPGKREDNTAGYSDRGCPGAGYANRDRGYTMNCVGDFVPPMFIFKRKRWTDLLTKSWPD